VPRVVTQSHPTEVDLLNLATGREDSEAVRDGKRHIDDGCRLCARRLEELTRLVDSIREGESFDDILSGAELPEIPRDTKPLPFIRQRQPLEEIYRVSREATEPAEHILEALRVSLDEVQNVIRSLDGDPRRGFAFLYA
jgi:hypothetical protein